MTSSSKSRSAAPVGIRPDLRVSKVEASTVNLGVGGKNIGRGQLVDLDELVSPGVRVRDVFPEEWFEVPAAAPVADPPLPSTDEQK
jgi:hypothetical protein